MKVLLVFTNIRTLIPAVYSFATGYLSAVLKKHNHQVRVFCANNIKEIPGISRVLKEYDPDIVGLTGIGSQFFYLMQIARLVKKWKNVPIICGGPHATLYPESFLESGYVDGALVGEGEESIVEYMDALESGSDYTGIKNFWFKKDGQIIKNEYREFIQDLDSLPYVDREIYDHQKLINIDNYTVYMLAGRGCPYNCTFCSVPYLRQKGKGEFSRLRSVDNVLGEIKLLSERYKFKHIYFRDDTFTWNKEWALEFFKKYPQNFDYPFDMLTRADCVDKEIVESLKHSKCDCVWMGIDSGNEYIRNTVLKKDISNESILKACRDLQAAGIKTLMTNMVGLPYETPERFQETIDLNKKIHSSRGVVSLASGSGPKIFAFNTFPGTVLYELAQKEGWLKPMKYGFHVYKESIIDMPDFPRKKVYRLRKKFRYLVYKDTQPFKAWFFRIYDSSLGQRLVKLIPMPLFGVITGIISKIVSSREWRVKK
ncbi:MAG: B12-binding domain-containing radical SAM protein [Candidatus Omnitrophica bacterium]|nr:B12-binding domain-containing radical SAM protein [Candidatus Omnitrophota bacterium]